MGWIIAVFVVALVLGPVMYLKPTAKENRLAALRLAARKAGLTVKLDSIPTFDPEPAERVSAGGEVRQTMRSCAAYQRGITFSEPMPIQFRALRMPPTPTVPVNEVHPGWALDPGLHGSFENKVGQGIYGLLDTVPTFCVGFSVDARFLSCYWFEQAQEGGTELDEIATFLESAESEIATLLTT
tara:strand:+ start:61 stop:612 length:552 start_codon:yes stop_codon:yes gene_type:complete